jgi:proteasome lid subunit RPN8/RPN11
LKRRLATRPLRGRFAITDAALSAAERILPTFRGPDGDHEGIAFLLGFELESITIFTSVLAPEGDHGPGHVFCSREQVLAASRAARAAGVSLLGQLHSHPHASSFHSEGDDHMVLMPFEGMLSIVAPHYGHFGLRPLDSLGVHQFQDGRWVACTRDSLSGRLLILPTEIDLR